MPLSIVRPLDSRTSHTHPTRLSLSLSLSLSLLSEASKIITLSIFYQWVESAQSSPTHLQIFPNHTLQGDAWPRRLRTLDPRIWRLPTGEASCRRCWFGKVGDVLAVRASSRSACWWAQLLQPSRSRTTSVKTDCQHRTAAAKNVSFPVENNKGCIWLVFRINF
jgi:hypothetical protein